jgi:ABC-2 type transport system permease protein
MNTIDIALKDLKHIFKNVFSLIMMFGAPLLITGLLYFAFGSLASGKGSFNLPVTKVQVVNLDQADPSSGLAAGKMLIDFLLDQSLKDVISITLVESETDARSAVDNQKAGAAIIIPPNFSAAVSTPGQTAAVIIYHDPTLTIAPGIIKDLVNHFMDSFSGAKISSQVTQTQLKAAGKQADPAQGYQAVQQYTTWLKANGHDSGSESDSQVEVISPVSGTQPKNQFSGMIGPIMAGMLIFFVFFMGANGAESIIREDEQGTLARLFTTPTSLIAILGGKFLGVVVSLCVQVVILLLASALLFNIQWGQAATVILVSLGLIVASAGFGVMLMSLIKNSRQTGPVLGGVMTLTGMLGGLITTGLPNLPSSFDRISLITPQGWALHGWKLALSGVGPSQVLVPVAVSLGLGILFLAIGSVVFRKRFA